MRLDMKILLTVTLCSFTLFCGTIDIHAKDAVAAQKDAVKKKETKVKKEKVKIRDITLNLPASWESSKPTSRLRLAQFEIPATKGDEYKTELQIFNFGGGGGGLDANIKRWIGQFDSTGRKVKVTKGESPQGEYYFIDIEGTYNMSVGPPFLRKTKACKNARMLAVILQVKGNKGNYFLKLPGTQQTVKSTVEHFRDSFNAVEKDEKEYQLK